MIVRPWKPLHALLTSPITVALWVQWHLIARCSTVTAVFCVFLPTRPSCPYVCFMYFLAAVYTQWGQGAEKAMVFFFLVFFFCNTHTAKALTTTTKKNKKKLFHVHVLGGTRSWRQIFYQGMEIIWVAELINKRKTN